jgi:hypothetical protein
VVWRRANLCGGGPRAGGRPRRPQPLGRRVVEDEPAYELV